MKYIDMKTILEETNGFASGKSPWDFLIEEASQKEVNSDDESEEDNQVQAGTDDGETEGSENGDDAEPNTDEEGLLSDDELQQLAEQLQQSSDMETDIKKLLDDGKINQADVEKLGQLLNGGEPSPEDERQYQINNIQEMVIRFNIYDKLNNLESKLDMFTDNFPNVDEEFFKDVSQIHQYIKVINSLIFNLEINLVYQIYANLEMKLTQLFTNYKNSTGGNR